MIAVCAMGGFLFLNTLYLQSVRGYSPVLAGLLILPMAATTAAAAPLSGAAGRRRARPLGAGHRGTAIAAGAWRWSSPAWSRPAGGPAAAPSAPMTCSSDRQQKAPAHDHAVAR